MTFDIPTNESPIIKVIGVGGGGGNAVTHMFSNGITGVDFAICNTDAQAMANSDVPTKISLGPNLTEGRGAGNRPEKGKEACIESIDEVRAFLSDNTKMLFVTAGMGGGTGTGAAPIIAKAAKEMGILTVGIVTIPFTMEGKKRINQAAEGLDSLKDNVDSLIVISNDKLFDLFPDLELDDAFQESDNILLTAAKGIAEIITVHGKINVDFADVHTVMKDSGPAIMGNGIAEGEGRAMEAIRNAITSPLLEDNNIVGAKNILLNMTSGPEDKLKMREMQEITNYIQDLAGEGTDLIWGNGVDESLGSKVSVTIIATGFQQDQKTQAGQPKVEVAPQPVAKTVEIVDLDGNVLTETVAMSSESPTPEKSVMDLDEKVPSFEIPKEEKAMIIDFTIDTPEPVLDTSKQYSEDMTPRVEEVVESHSVERKASPMFASLGDAESYTNQQSFDNLENVPAYKRLKVELEDIDTTTSPMEQYNTISIDESGEIVTNKNPFFEDNID